MKFTAKTFMLVTKINSAGGFMKSIVRLIGTVLLSTLFLTSCLPSFHSHLKARNFDHMIDLEVDGNQLSTNTKPKGNCKKDGCVQVDVNWSATIRFHLKASGNWELTELKICEGLTKTGVCELKSWQTRDFVAYANTRGTKVYPDENGVVDLTSLSTAPLKQFYLFDFNLNSGEYHYSIKACKPDPQESSDCIMLDPPIVNEGSSNIYVN